MPTQNYDGSWTGDDGNPIDPSVIAAQQNDASYNARPWGTRLTDGPAPAPGSFDTGGFSQDEVNTLLQQPGVRAGIAYYLAKGERPDLNKIAAQDQQVIPGYKNMGSSEVQDHSLKNGLIGIAGVAGAGALQGLGLLGSASGGATAGAAAPTTDAGSTISSMVGGASVPSTEGISSAGALGLPTTAGLGTAGAASSTAALPAVSDLGSVDPATVGGFTSPQAINNSVPWSVAGNGFDTPGSTIGKILGTSSNGLSDLSKLLGNFSSGQKANRVVQGNATSKYDQQALADQRGAAAARAGALKELAQSNYILSGGFQPQNQSIQLNGQTRAVPQIGMAPLPASDAQKAAAANLQTTAQGILAPGGTVSPSPIDQYGATPGTAENIGSYGATIAGMLPAVKSIYNLFS